MATDAVALAAAIGSRTVRSFLDQTNAAIAVWRGTEEFTVSKFSANPSRLIRTQCGETEVVWDEDIRDRLRMLRQRRLPKETGGVIYGVRDLSRNVLYIVDVTGAPSDSKEWPTAFIRGSAGVAKGLAEASQRTSGMVEYIGEWHSHPDRCSVEPSSDDEQVYTWIAEHQAKDGYPAVMLIVGKHDFNWLVGSPL